jgi:hypothetical protein
MAFHQPTRQVVRRTSHTVAPNSTDLEELAPRPPLTQSRDESQTWVLFSPATDSGTSVSYLSSIPDDQPTPGRSRISDIGSLQTIAHSENPYSEPANSDVLVEDDAIEDDAEFDSLDSHLPDFLHRGQQGGNTQSTTIFPGHDGLGSFRLDTQGMATEMQETIYQFERYNPRRVKRRRESLELGQLALESEEAQEADRRRRIEEWRLEQSRVLLHEIQKETRRRRESTVSALTGGLRRGSQAFAEAEAEAEDAALSTVDDPTPDASMAGTEWHDQDGSEIDLGTGETEEAGYWTRLTRSVIRDLMGIDDKLLCVLFGEALPEDMDLDIDDLSSTPRAAAHGSSVAESNPSWQLQLLDRMARELGDLVNQLSAHPHPGGFSTYTRMHQMPLPYAGLPVIPEAAATPPQYASVQAVSTAAEPNEAKRPAPSRMSSNAEDSTMPAMPKFQPTLQAVRHAQPMDIPRTKASDGAGEAYGPEKLTGTFTQQEWEQDLDIKLVFRYLRNRFTSSRAAAANPSGHSQSHTHNTPSTQDAAARAAARVRQHHPLVRGVHSHPRRTSFKISVPAGAQGQLVRHASSCASQSTKRSGRRGSMSVSSRHSSRHYWDLGARDGAGSIGTGSMITSTGPMGSWGEV